MTVIEPSTWIPGGGADETGGAALGPEAILAASVQVDLFDPAVPDAWKIGVALDDMPGEVREAATRESVMHFEVDRRLGAEELADLETRIRSILGDVRLTVRDFEGARMTERHVGSPA